MSNANTAVAKQEAKPLGMTVKGLLTGEGFKSRVQAALPKHLSADRYMRIVNNTVLRTPKLLECDPNSFANALLLLSQYGIEPDGRRAHLIPFKNSAAKRTECQLIIDWKGLAELILRNGNIVRLHADVICENDDFDFDMGDVLHHRIDFRKERGEPYAAWAMAQTRTGERFVQVMQRAEIEKIRDNSSGYRAFKAGYTKTTPWGDHAAEMWKKTVFRRLSKWLPLSPELRDAVELDDEEQLPATTVAPTTPVAVIPFEMPPEAEGDSEPNEPETTAEAKTPQVELMEFVTSNGYTFDHLKTWGDGTGSLPDGDSITGFREIPNEVATRLLRAKAGLLKGLETAKG